MRKHAKVRLKAGVSVMSLAASSALFAHDSRKHGMMGRDGMKGNGAMMGMMGSMMRMMEPRSQMMQDGSRRPNDQWRHIPSAPGEKG